MQYALYQFLRHGHFGHAKVAGVLDFRQLTLVGHLPIVRCHGGQPVESLA